MFLGHFAVAFGAKAAVPRTSLGTLFLATQFVDLLWPTLLLLDIERVAISPGITTVTPLDFTSYPISHSLLMVCAWGILFGVIAWLVGKDIRAAAVLGCCVVSHWFLDLVVHRPDLPLIPEGSTLAGWGLWNSLPGTLLVEFGLLAAGIITYTVVTRARRRSGSIVYGALIGLLVVIYLFNLLGPVPPNTDAIAWGAQGLWLLVALAYWVDHDRVTTRERAGAERKSARKLNRGGRNRARSKKSLDG